MFGTVLCGGVVSRILVCGAEVSRVVVCGALRIRRITFCTRGIRAMNLVTRPYSYGSVTGTTCIFPIRELGPHTLATCGSWVSRRSSNPGCLVLRLIACYT